MIRLMLVDDHAMLREGLRIKFEANPDLRVVAETGSARSVLALLDEKRPDVVILDIKLPDGSGISLIRRIKAAAPRCRVVVLTMYDHVRYALHALESGADGFVVKGAPFEELLEAVREAVANRTYVSSDMAPKLMARFRRRQGTSALETLSPREFEALTMLSSGLSLKETAARMGVSEKTASTYRTRLMEKLSISNNADLIRFALESGLLE